MRVSLLSLAILFLLVLVVVSTADAKRHHRSGDAMLIQKKSIFRGKSKEKPKSWKQKLQDQAIKQVVKGSLKKITRKGGK
ncbi:expressed protein [Echinococcus multilocularis]|uniref:Expressed protein n=1 Tax=Echinococcus multilocularis TaxID=6211 RepID=A0A068Y716_ECHMU|nr:expressed protein [Echinococcus multilocularis]